MELFVFLVLLFLGLSIFWNVGGFLLAVGMVVVLWEILPWWFLVLAGAWFLIEQYSDMKVAEQPMRVQIVKDSEDISD